MTDQHVKGAVSTARGVVEESAGKLAGDKGLEAKGKAHQVQGKAQNILGDVKDAAPQTRHRCSDAHAAAAVPTGAAVALLCPGGRGLRGLS